MPKASGPVATMVLQVARPAWREWRECSHQIATKSLVPASRLKSNQSALTATKIQALSTILLMLLEAKKMSPAQSLRSGHVSCPTSVGSKWSSQIEKHRMSKTVSKHWKYKRYIQVCLSTLDTALPQDLYINHISYKYCVSVVRVNPSNSIILPSRCLFHCPTFSHAPSRSTDRCSRRRSGNDVLRDCRLGPCRCANTYITNKGLP